MNLEGIFLKFIKKYDDDLKNVFLLTYYQLALPLFWDNFKNNQNDCFERFDIIKKIYQIIIIYFR